MDMIESLRACSNGPLLNSHLWRLGRSQKKKHRDATTFDGVIGGILRESLEG